MNRVPHWVLNGFLIAFLTRILKHYSAERCQEVFLDWVSGFDSRFDWDRLGLFGFGRIIHPNEQTSPKGAHGGLPLPHLWTTKVNSSLVPPPLHLETRHHRHPVPRHASAPPLPKRVAAGRRGHNGRAGGLGRGRTAATSRGLAGLWRTPLPRGTLPPCDPVDSARRPLAWGSWPDTLNPAPYTPNPNPTPKRYTLTSSPPPPLRIALKPPPPPLRPFDGGACARAVVAGGWNFRRGATTRW